jgi:hypothetical protein
LDLDYVPVMKRKNHGSVTDDAQGAENLLQEFFFDNGQVSFRFHRDRQAYRTFRFESLHCLSPRARIFRSEFYVPLVLNLASGLAHGDFPFAKKLAQKQKSHRPISLGGGILELLGL